MGVGVGFRPQERKAHALVLISRHCTAPDFGGNFALFPQELDRELKDLSTMVSQELECVNRIVISQPQEVPAQLLKALEKDAKNLQKSLSSVSDSWSSRFLHIQNAMEAKKVVSWFGGVGFFVFFF